MNDVKPREECRLRYAVLSVTEDPQRHVAKATPRQVLRTRSGRSIFKTKDNGKRQP